MGIMSDYDPVETQEWGDSLRAMLRHAGTERVRYLLARLDEALSTGMMPQFLATTPYRNTILPGEEAKLPGAGGRRRLTDSRVP